MAGLPGDDFLLKAVNVAVDEWLNRPAEYADMRRALHVILVLHLDFPVEEAVTYNPHGFKHVLVTSAQQLRTHGLVSEDDIERLGHWAKGSRMPRDYDSAAGVSELATRSAVLQQIRRGWRPGEDGMLPPAPVEPKEETIEECAVGHKRRKTIHKWKGGTVSLCKWWSCGSRSRPSADALFQEVPDHWKKCHMCW